MAQQARVRIAQIGVGGMGAGHVAAVRQSERAELVAVCDASPEALQAATAVSPAATFTDFRRLFDEADFDALICVLPHDLYPEVVELCARHKVHLLKEKPFARDLSDALEMHALVKQSGIKFLSAAQRQYSQTFQRAHERIAGGQTGDIFLTQASMYYQWRLDPSTWAWRGEGRRSGGIAVIDSGWHMLDAISWLKGLPATVYCRIGNAKAVPGRYDVDDKAVLAFDFDDGSVGSLTVCFLTKPARYEILLHGTEETLEIGSSHLRVHPRGGGETETIEDPGTNLLVAQLEHFLDVILDDAEPRVSIDDALQLQRVVQAAYESAATGRRVDLVY